MDSQGRLIGINTAILSRTGGNQGIGFAIPVSLARDVMEALVRDGKVTRGYLGVMIQDINPALAKKFGLEDAKGALVGEVTPKGPAAKAGIESGDVIAKLNGRDVKDSRHLKLAVARVAPGDTATLTVLRDGKEKTIKVKVDELPGDNTVAQSSKVEDEGTLNGVGVADLDNKNRRQFNVPEKVEGALVTQVDPDSDAAAAGLQPGDVILEINRSPVKDAEEAVKMTSKANDKTTLLKVWSRGGSRYIVVDESNNSQG